MSYICKVPSMNVRYIINIQCMLFYKSPLKSHHTHQVTKLYNRFFNIQKGITSIFLCLFWINYGYAIFWGLLQWLSSGEFACSAGDTGDMSSIPGSRRSPGEGNGNPLQYSCLENPRDRGAWWATVHGWQRVRHDWVTNTDTLGIL